MFFESPLFGSYGWDIFVKLVLAAIAGGLVGAGVIVGRGTNVAGGALLKLHAKATIKNPIPSA